MLARVVQRRHPLDVPSAGDIVVHMRTGSGLEGPDCWNNVSHCTQIVPGACCHFVYALPRTYYAKVMAQLPRPTTARAKRIVIVTSINSCGAWECSETIVKYSLAYLKQAYAYFEEQGYQVEVRTPHGVDTDFMYMASARTFVLGGGGFSAFVGSVVNRSGGRAVHQGSLCGDSNQLCMVNGTVG